MIEKNKHLRNFDRIVETVANHTGTPKVRILAKGRKGGQITSRYIVSCALDYLTRYSRKPDIAKLLPIGRCSIYNGWVSLMATYLFYDLDREIIDETFLELTGKTFPECERDMYNNLYKKKQILYERFWDRPDEKYMIRRIDDRKFINNQLNRL